MQELPFSADSPGNDEDSHLGVTFSLSKVRFTRSEPRLAKSDIFLKAKQWHGVGVVDGREHSGGNH